MTARSSLKLSDVMAQHAKNKAAPGIILPRVKDRMLKQYGYDADRDPTVIHPSEMAKDDWCPRATYLRIVSGEWPGQKEKFDFVRENIFATGNDIHQKWQDRIIDAGFAVWGDWKCSRCKKVVANALKPDWAAFGGVCAAATIDHYWEYQEVTLNAKRELLIAGHADCGFDDTLVEIKSIGLGTIRMDAPDLLARHTNGKHTDLTGLWRDITRPLRSHLRQGDVYLHLAHVLGLPFTQIVYLYEFKANQLTKEFTVKYDAGRSMLLVAKAQEIKYAVDHGIPRRASSRTSARNASCSPRRGGPLTNDEIPGQLTLDEWTVTHARIARWSATEDVLADVSNERESQHEQWGDQVLPMGTGPAFAEEAGMYRAICRDAAADGDLTYADILLEEVFEALAEEDPLKAKDELIQVAAVAVKMVELINRQVPGATAP